MSDRLIVMRSIHLVIPDLFLPQQIAAEACAGLALPALGTLLARAQPAPLSAESLEAWLCAAFGMTNQAIAPITLRADGLDPGAGYWFRADPVYLHFQRDQLILHADVPLTADDAAKLCSSLNAHFAAENLHFFAPHPQRWYLQLDAEPNMNTHPLTQAVGRDVHAYLAQGADALRWHGIVNEIQMLLFEHAVNQEREARGELSINSVWLWGGGYAADKLGQPYSKIYCDSELAAAFAQTAAIPYGPLPDDGTRFIAGNDGDVLIVWEGLHRALQQGELHVWREELQRFEHCCAKPLLNLLRTGRIAQLTLDSPQIGTARRFVLTRGAAWKMWRRSQPLARYAA